MRRGRAAAALCAALLVARAALASPFQDPAQNARVTQLDNGLTVLTLEDHATPVVSFQIWVRVGSGDEARFTGLAHLFEHMLFKGTRTIGTTKLERDLAIIAEQEKLQEKIRELYRAQRTRWRRGEVEDPFGPESRTPELVELEEQLAALVEEQRGLMVKDELDKIYTEAGATGLNAGTDEDLTFYFVTVPANKLELWFWVESDRLHEPVFREFYSERDVVHEERRRSTEATPLGKFDEAFNALFWEAAPYKWPVVGWASDLASISKADADAYFSVYYAANNLTGVLVGDFESAEVRPLIERYFGRVPRGRSDPPEVVTLEPKQIGEKRYNAEAETSPTVRIWYHSVPFVHRDRTVADLLSDILSGRTGRLYKGLVQGRELANEAQASVSLKKYAGVFEIEAVVKDGKEPAAVEAAVYEELERLAREPVPDAELQKVKNQAKANAFRRLSSPFFIALQLLYYDGLGDWKYINTYSDEVDRVTAADLQRVARAHFTKENRTVGTFVRKAGAPAEPDDPELAALPEQVRPMARQQLGQIAAETDAARLREGIAQMTEAQGQAPPEAKPVIELLLKRAQERLAALEGGQK